MISRHTQKFGGYASRQIAGEGFSPAARASLPGNLGRVHLASGAALFAGVTT